MPFNLEPSTERRQSADPRRCLLMAFALIALALTVLPTASFAGTDTAGQRTCDRQLTPIRPASKATCTGPAKALNLDDASIDRDIIAAGDTLSIRDCTVGGAIRLAARTIDICQNRDRWQRDGSRSACRAQHRQHRQLFLRDGRDGCPARLCQVGSARGRVR